jgi:hypothetical protein
MFYEVEGALPGVLSEEAIDKIMSFGMIWLDIPGHTEVTLIFDEDLVASKTDGWADEVEADEGLVDISIRPDMSYEDLVATIFHELVHVRQIVRGELIQASPSIWNGKAYKGDYLELPWEKEAYELEHKMVSAFFTRRRNT